MTPEDNTDRLVFATLVAIVRSLRILSEDAGNYSTTFKGSVDTALRVLEALKEHLSGRGL